MKSNLRIKKTIWAALALVFVIISISFVFYGDIPKTEILSISAANQPM